MRELTFCAPLDCLSFPWIQYSLVIIVSWARARVRYLCSVSLSCSLSHWTNSIRYICAETDVWYLCVSPSCQPHPAKIYSHHDMWHHQWMSYSNLEYLQTGMPYTLIPRGESHKKRMENIESNERFCLLMYVSKAPTWLSIGLKARRKTKCCIFSW